MLAQSKNSSTHLSLTPLLLDLSSVVCFNIFQLDGMLPSQVCRFLFTFDDRGLKLALQLPVGDSH